MLGGSGSPGIGELFAVVSRWGGLAESRVLLRGVSLPARRRAAERQHGACARFRRHARHRRLDPSRRLGIGCGAGPSGDSLGHVTGKELLLAVALGLDVSCRVALASTVDRGGTARRRWASSGPRPPPVNCCGLTPEQMLAAFGVAYSHAAGNRQCILDGALSKRMQAGQAASAGVFSAVLSQTGFTGATTFLMAVSGSSNCISLMAYDPSVLLRGLGTAFRGEALSYKPYPCGRPPHAAIDAALAARAQLSNRAEPTRSPPVMIEAEPTGHGDQFERGPAKRRPTQVVEAQFAQPFLVATAWSTARSASPKWMASVIPRCWPCPTETRSGRTKPAEKGR